jgi:hypothetical protein
MWTMRLAMTLTFLPWAAAPPSQSDGPGLPFLTASIPLIALLLVGALVIYFVDRWRKRTRAVSPPTNDQLAHFRSLYERGEMSAEEFDRVKALLAGQLRKEMNVPAPPVPFADLDPDVPDEPTSPQTDIQSNPPPPQGYPPKEEPRA